MSKPNFNFRCRPLVCCLGVLLLLAGCQSIAPSSAPLDNKQAFLQYHKSSTKADFVRAMDAHLASERVVLTDYYQQRAVLPKQTLDTGDNFLLSALKTYAYKNPQNADDVPMADDDLHLRYYDKLANTAPNDYDLTYGQATTPAMLETNKQIHKLAGQYRACVTELSYDVDSLLKDNPALTADSSAFQDRQRRFNHCLSQVQKHHQGIDDNPTAYQRADLQLIRQCASTYQKNLSQALAKSRQLKRYEGADFEVYESVYGNFAVCHAQFEMGYRLDPVNEDEEGISPKLQQMTHETRLCAITNQDAQDKLQQQGKTYANDPQAYASVFYEYFGCLGGKYGKVYDGTDGSPIGSPTTLTDAEEAFELHQELLASEDEQSDEEKQQGWLSAYFDMKSQEKDANAKLPLWAGEVFDTLQAMQMTPKQIDAYNSYYANHAHMTTLSHHTPKNRTVSSVLAMEFDVPTASYRVQLPFLADFNGESLTADMSPVLAVSALLAPEHTPILTNHTGKIVLPKELQKIPLSIIYDSVQAGYKNGLMALDESVFSQIEPKSAPFADKFSADKVVKLNLTAKQTGKLFGAIIKQLQKDLSEYVDNHPQTFDPEQQTTQTLKTRLEKWAMLNDGYHVGDVGRVLQLIESILPLELVQTQHFYLKSGELVGQVAKVDVKYGMMNLQDETLAVTSYHSPKFVHPLSSALTNNHKATEFEVNVWLNDLRQAQDDKTQAKNARQSYLLDEQACETAECAGETAGD